MRRKEDLHYRGYDVDSYLLHCSCPRFGTGEGKAVINESVRGTDVFVMVDVMNYSIPYTVSGYTNHMSPDDHFQDLKRIDVYKRQFQHSGKKRRSDSSTVSAVHYI